MKQDRQDPFERWPELDTLFERVLDLPPAERAGFLDEACRGDAGLRHELESLLAAYDGSADFLDDADAWLGERPALPRPADSVLPDPRVGSTISHYEVIERLGEGGMGVVYRAHDHRLDRTVTLKFIQPLLGAELQAKARFIQEARAASALDHPNICTIYEIDETAEGQLFIAMAYYAGETLAKRLERGPLPLEQAFDVADAIGNGLARAHEAGIVHRDLKPANVILTDRGEVRILDFGIAKLEGQDHTRTGARLGTAAYMSPEQASGRHIDRRTDVWALGALLYEMVSGRRPFGRDNEQAAIYAILNEEPEPISTHRPDAGEELDALIRHALAKKADERYADMAALLEDLAAIRAQTSSTQPTARSTTQVPTAPPKWRRRGPILAGSAILLLVIVLMTVRLTGAVPALADLAFWSRTGPIDFEERDWILITDLENHTGDVIFDRSLNNAIDIAVRQSQYVNVFPRSRVRETLLRMGRADEPVLDETLAAEVALRENLKAVLVFEISRIDSTYVLATHIVDPGNGLTVRTETARAVGKARVLDAVDDLSRELRADMGESLRSIRRRSVPLPDATTHSLEALKHHADGAAAWSSGNFTGAQTLWREAIALDSTFAWAHASLAMSVAYLNGRSAARPYLVKARSLLGRVTERERLWILGLIGDTPEAVEALDLYTQLYPGDRDAWYNLGNNLRKLNRNEEALDAYRRSVEADSLCAWCWTNTAMALTALGRNVESAGAFERAFDLQPSLRTDIAGAINRTYGFVLAALGNEDGARAVFQALLPRGARDRAFGLRSLGLLALAQGRAVEAIERLEAERAIIRTEGFPINAFMNQLYLASANRVKGRVGDARQALRFALQIADSSRFGPASLVLLGKQLARQGEQEAAMAVLDLMAAALPADSSILTMASMEQMRGELALSRGDNATARARLRSAYALWQSPDRLESLAQAHYAAGRLDDAARTFTRFIASVPLGTEAEEYWLQAFQKLGDIHEQMGEPDEALEYYTRLLELWKDADPDLPELQAVRNRVPELESR